MTSKKTNDGGQQKPITDDAVLKVAKEVVIKFIEVGRLTPTTFDETFKAVFQSIMDTVNDVKQ